MMGFGSIGMLAMASDNLSAFAIGCVVAVGFGADHLPVLDCGPAKDCAPASPSMVSIPRSREVARRQPYDAQGC